MGRPASTTFPDEETRAARRILEFLDRWQTGDPKHLISLPPVETFGKQKAVLPTSGRAFMLGTSKRRQIRAQEPLDTDSLVAAGFLADGGFRIGKHGTTGTKQGRPLKGATSVPFIRGRIQEKLGAYPLERVTLILHLKRRGQAEQLIYDLFAEVAVELIGAQIRPVNRKAFGEAMGCNRKTIDRLYDHGEIQMSQKSPKEGEGKSMTQTAAKIDATHALAARIALVQTMHGEALDRIRETVQELKERFPDDHRIQDAVQPWLEPEEEQEAA